ncbi:OsmC family protein [Streptomyces spectabilis]|uniref:OsmC family peroxiredoxin n=1 Tax=Streptomyces spectabilis TaxID=68270 RepID=A0A5P2X1F4_STRST|nr:OsmC family protein [Streptomyces spectabilis]MBB5101531.1 putative redox protein [Streptomyces spectabilis]MCI3900720.1 OsmC family protein [Streptomyces spectabilis]QEV58261.1 OsmC family peroxiredoxin [Streptomyces spectabilis]GGV11981.1 osmotically inducible protein C [Streptomyces spectabilis]
MPAPHTPAQQQSTSAQDPAEAGLVVVSENGFGPYGQQVRAGHHRLAVDEPEPLGTDSGPGPYDLLLASLGACVSMFIRAYAARKGWSLEKVTVSLRHRRVRAGDSGNRTVSQITQEIRLDGPLDAGQRRRLMKTAENCPVHRTLTEGALINTTPNPAHP